MGTVLVRESNTTKSSLKIKQHLPEINYKLYYLLCASLISNMLDITAISTNDEQMMLRSNVNLHIYRNWSLKQYKHQISNQNERKKQKPFYRPIKLFVLFWRHFLMRRARVWLENFSKYGVREVG